MPVNSMLMTTTSSIEGQAISRYLGVVAGEAAIAPIELRDFAAFIRREGAGRHPEFEKLVRETRQVALLNLQTEAQELGANGLIGIDFDYAYLASDGLVMITVSGTAVLLAEKRPS
ncbi:MAG: heavy metal-binding domain-containing protein [Planctomycetes bacterium]|nr:heavy metal-binding domain-containing protein [Planctomycetota bacterium]